MTTKLSAEMFIFPERREVPSATTTASTTAAAAATTTPPETGTTPEAETTPAEAAETVGTAATTSVSGDRKIIINLKDIYRCPATGKKNIFNKNVYLLSFIMRRKQCTVPVKVG
jgi:hypothetical protein